MTRATKSALWRMDILRQAEDSGNVSEVCRRHGINRSTFYQWRNRFDAHGLEGLADRPSGSRGKRGADGRRSERIKHLALRNPAAGCDKLCRLWGRDGETMSSVTLQNILNSLGLGTRAARGLALERMLFAGEPLSAEQVAFAEELNPALRERQLRPALPGALIYQDHTVVGQVAGNGRLHLHLAIDAASGYSFAVLDFAMGSYAAAFLLGQQVAPFLVRDGLQIEAVMTRACYPYVGPNSSDFRRQADRLSVEHITVAAGTGGRIGHIDRFAAIVRQDFFATRPRRYSASEIGALNNRFATWMDHQNRKESPSGFPNFGTSSYAIYRELLISAFKSGGQYNRYSAVGA